MAATDDQLLTIEQVSDYLGVSYRTVTRWVSSGRLQAVRIGPRTRRIRRGDLARIVQPE